MQVRVISVVQGYQGIVVGLVPLLVYVPMLLLDPTIGSLGWVPFILLGCALVASVTCLCIEHVRVFGIALLATSVFDILIGCIITYIYIGFQLGKGNV